MHTAVIRAKERERERAAHSRLLEGEGERGRESLSGFGLSRRHSGREREERGRERR